jgi:spore maturation protein CgeB
MKIMGHPHYVPKSSPIWEFVPPENFNPDGSIRTIPHEETVRYYNGARVTLNFMRDTSWNPTSNGKDNPWNSLGIVAESLNPRAYEVPLCGSVQLLEDTRAEAREIFGVGEVGFFSDAKSLKKALGALLKEDEAELRYMRMRAAQRVLGGHTYVHRMDEILAKIAS